MRISLLFFAFVSWLMHSISLHAQILSVDSDNANPGIYEKKEWTIRLKEAWSNPYDPEQIDLKMEYVDPIGLKNELPAFYVSGESGGVSLWKIRFAPMQTGIYKICFVLKNRNKEVSRTDESLLEVRSSEKKGFLRPYNSWCFRYDNGEFFRGLGENICWESRDEDDSRYFKNLHEDPRFNYQYMLGKLAANGGNFFRTWMIYWNLPIDWRQVNNNRRYRNTQSVYNESGMQRMDKLVELCDSLGLHMMLALESHVGYMGSGWENSSYNRKNGGFADTPTQFFASAESRRQYKQKLRLMIARYGYSPSIGAWEFFNEIDNIMYNGTPDEHIPDSIVTDWHREMSAYLKANDPYRHLITTSISHRDVAGLNQIENIDLNQKHIYCNTAGIPQTIVDYSTKYAKPYAIGEFGFHWDWSLNFNDLAPEFDRDFKKGLWLGLFSPTPILPMSWWWEFFEDRGLMSYFKNVDVIRREMLATGKGSFIPLPVSAGKGSVAYAVRCGSNVYVYLSNNEETATSVDLSLDSFPETPAEVMMYDTETVKKSPFSRYSKQSNRLLLEKIELAPYADKVFCILHRTSETQALLANMKSKAADGYMFGHQDATLYGVGWEGDKERSDIKSICNDYPAVIGFDLGHLELDNEKNLDGVSFKVIRDEIIRHYQRGGIVTISWHADNPLTGGSAWDVSDKNVVRSVLPGGKEHEKFCTWLSKMAAFFNSLQADGVKVPVIFRPWHEHTGSWFWWGQNLCTVSEYRDLWNMTIAQFNRAGVNNLIYAYSPGGDAENYFERYPGDGIIDLLGFDTYQGNKPGDERGYRELLKKNLALMDEYASAHDKIYAVTETGFNKIPESDWWTNTLDATINGYKPAYVLVWRNAREYDKDHFFAPYPGQSSATDFRQLCNQPNVFLLNDITNIYQQ